MSTCPDCRYCAPRSGGQPGGHLPKPARWFDQPCLHCGHRLKAHDPGVPGALGPVELGVPAGGPPVATRS